LPSFRIYPYFLFKKACLKEFMDKIDFTKVRNLLGGILAYREMEDEEL
jgi:hypothetical protein